MPSGFRAKRDEADKPEKVYEATFYCSLLIHASSQREAIQKVMEITRRNHLKIEDGVSDGLHVHRHRPNGMISQQKKVN